MILSLIESMIDHDDDSVDGKETIEDIIECPDDRNADITVDHYLKNITCAAKTYDYNETAYTVKYAVSPEESVDTSSLADGSTKFGNLVSGTTYAITAKITVDGQDYTDTCAVTVSA